MVQQVRSLNLTMINFYAEGYIDNFHEKTLRTRESAEPIKYCPESFNL